VHQDYTNNLRFKANILFFHFNNIVDFMTKTIDEIMSKNLEMINSSSSAQETAKKMSEKNVSSLLVTANNGRPVGIVTEQDLVRRVVAEDVGSASSVVQHIMSSPLVTIDPKSSVEVAADVMLQNNVRHLLVVENEDIRRPLGIVTVTDFAGYLKTDSGPT
jgi:CBS domain-containing protein